MYAVAEDRLQRVKRMYESGLTTYAIAAELGWSQPTIANDVKRLGIGRTPHPPRKYPAPAERECARDGCRERFTPTGSDVARGNGRYCSKECVAIATARPRTKGVMRKCKRPKCNKQVWVWDAHARRGGKRCAGYCSQECAGLGKWDQKIDDAAPGRALRASLESRGLWSPDANQRWAKWDGHKGYESGIHSGRSTGPTKLWALDPDDEKRATQDSPGFDEIHALCRGNRTKLVQGCSERDLAAVLDIVRLADVSEKRKAATFELARRREENRARTIGIETRIRELKAAGSLTHEEIAGLVFGRPGLYDRVRRVKPAQSRLTA